VDFRKKVIFRAFLFLQLLQLFVTIWQLFFRLEKWKFGCIKCYTTEIWNLICEHKRSYHFEKTVFLWFFCLQNCSQFNSQKNRLCSCNFLLPSVTICMFSIVPIHKKFSVTNWKFQKLFLSIMLTIKNCVFWQKKSFSFFNFGQKNLVQFRNFEKSL